MLSRAGIGYPRTHNLRLLMDLLADSGYALPADLADLDLLTPYGTLFRYEDLPAEFELDREMLFKMVRALHEFVEKEPS